MVTGDLLSITAYVSQFSEWLFGADPVEAFLKPFIGNWDALYASGVEFERYAKALTAIGHDLQWLSDQIPGFWDGNAAANCREQMLDLGGKIAATAPSFAKGAGAFKSAANDAWTAYDYASGFVRDAVDAIMPLAGEIKIGAKIPARAADTVKFVKEIYQDLTKRADIIDSDIKLYNALPEGVKAPDLQIPGFSVALGGWFNTSPRTTGK